MALAFSQNCLLSTGCRGESSFTISNLSFITNIPEVCDDYWTYGLRADSDTDGLCEPGCDCRESWPKESKHKHNDLLYDFRCKFPC